MNRMGYIMGRKGFTLIELIIAVALLAVAGTVAVRLFVHAHVNNQLAADIDQSVFYGSAWIEQIKSSPEDWVDEAPQALDPVVSMSEPYSYIIYYNSDWTPLAGNQDQPEEAAYAMHIDLYRMNGSDGLWAIELRTFKLEPYLLRQETHQEINRLSAMINVPGEVMGP